MEIILTERLGAALVAGDDLSVDERLAIRAAAGYATVAAGGEMPRVVDLCSDPGPPAAVSATLLERLGARVGRQLAALEARDDGPAIDDPGGLGAVLDDAVARADARGGGAPPALCFLAELLPHLALEQRRRLQRAALAAARAAAAGEHR